MKNLFLLLLLCVPVLPLTAQDRGLPNRRTHPPAPRLSALIGTDNAAGIAQSPSLQVIVLSEWSIPAGSTVGIYGSYLIKNNVTKLWLLTDGAVQVVDAEAHSMRVPNLEMIVFRLPADVSGEVWVTVAGRQISNTVKITAEQ